MPNFRSLAPKSFWQCETTRSLSRVVRAVQLVDHARKLWGFASAVAVIASVAARATMMYPMRLMRASLERGPRPAQGGSKAPSADASRLRRCQCLERAVDVGGRRVEMAGEPDRSGARARPDVRGGEALGGVRDRHADD